MGLIESIGTGIGAKAGETLWKTMTQLYDDWRQGRKHRLSTAVNPLGGYEFLPEGDGYTRGTVDVILDVEPVILSGLFFPADRSFADFLDELLEDAEKVVVLVVFDERTRDVLLVEFDFDGYAMEFWPGKYSLYAYIIDPLLDEVLAYGFPASSDGLDPNPIILKGSGQHGLDFILFEAENDLDDGFDADDDEFDDDDDDDFDDDDEFDDDFDDDDFDDDDDDDDFDDDW